MQGGGAPDILDNAQRAVHTHDPQFHRQGLLGNNEDNTINLSNQVQVIHNQLYCWYKEKQEYSGLKPNASQHLRANFRSVMNS